MALAIGFDAKRIFENATGLGSYGRTVIRNLRRLRPEVEIRLFTPRASRLHLADDLWNDPVIECVTPAHPLVRPVWREWLMTSDIVASKVDLFHGLSNELPLGIGNLGCASVVTLHDLIFKFYPRDYPWIDRKIYDAKSRRACQVATVVIAASESARQDLIACYGVNPDKVRVVYQGCDPEFFRRGTPQEIAAARDKQRLPPEYLLSVGSIIPRKNLLGLVQAWALLSPSQRLPLVVVGKSTAYADDVRRWIERNGLSAQVHFCTKVTNEDLRLLYQGARAFAYPSLYEGFGIPIVEAMASGVPVVTSNVSSLPEAAGGGALLVDPKSCDEMARALEKVLGDDEVRSRLAQGAQVQLQRLAPERLIEDLMEAYAAALSLHAERRSASDPKSTSRTRRNVHES